MTTGAASSCTPDGLILRLDFRDSLLPHGLELVRPDRLIEAWTLSEVPAAIAALEAAWAAGETAAGFIAYEAAPGICPHLRTAPPDATLPLVWFVVGSFRDATPLTVASGAVSAMVASLDQDTYCTRVRKILAAIRNGETYQLNFTFPLNGRLSGSAAGLYQSLLTAQSARYGATMGCPAWQILSASPELFFRIENGRIESRPMKGTRARGRTGAEDAVTAAALQNSPKERAENVMIVDLLRNDIGAIAAPGSVRASSLFQLERYPTVWQMTSTVTGELPPDRSLAAILAALFPCGSVTGAPKRRTMDWIADCEDGPRGVYCGAIGALLPGRQAVFSVPIRTLTLLPDGRLCYPVGSGIVADAEPASEYAECLAKAQLLARAAAPPFHLLETILWDSVNGFLLLEAHLARLSASATYFDRPYDEDRCRQALTAAALKAADGPRLRLLMAADGQVTVENTPFIVPSTAPVRLALATSPIDSRDPFLFHKTTHRAVYAPAVADRDAFGVDDIIQFNEYGHLTETITGNIAVCLSGIWYTPPVDDGLLAGTYRTTALAEGTLQVRSIHREELAAAAGIVVMNSVRGRQSAVLIHPA